MIPNLPLEELARRYNNGLAVPGWMETLLPRWQRESEHVRTHAGGTRNERYGPLERNLLDVFTPGGAPPANGWPTLVFIHGGYWQRLWKDDWSVIAKPFIANGDGGCDSRLHAVSANDDSRYCERSRNGHRASLEKRGLTRD